MTRWLGGVVTFCSVSAVAALAAADKDRYDPGEAIPPFTLKVVNADESGEPYIGIDRYYGAGAKEPKKAIILSFFATYCEPCKKEMPYLAALYDAYKDKGLAVLSVSIDKDADKVDIAKNLAKENNVKFPVLSDRFNIVAKRYFINKLPCVYLVNGEGKVAMVNVGYNDDISKRLLDEVRKAIGEPASAPVPELVAKHMTGHGGAPAAVDVPADGSTSAPGAPAADAGKPAEGEATAEGAPDKAAAASDAAPAAAEKGKAKGKAKGKGKGKGKGKKK